MKPPEEFELSLPLLCRPRVKGVDPPGGDSDRFAFAPGDVVPGDLDSGGTYRCAAVVDVNGRGDVDLGLGDRVCV